MLDPIVLTVTSTDSIPLAGAQHSLAQSKDVPVPVPVPVNKPALGDQPQHGVSTKPADSGQSAAAKPPAVAPSTGPFEKVGKRNFDKCVSFSPPVDRLYVYGCLPERCILQAL